MSPTNGHAHLEDGNLVRFLSDEVTTDERARAVEHLSRCEDCARRLEGWSADMASVAGLLADLPVTAMDPARRARSLAAVRQAAVRKIAAPAAARAPRRRFFLSGTLARAAAVAALFVAGGVVASPAGAWIADRFRDLFQDEPATVAAPESEALSATGSVVAFTPFGYELTVEVASTQAQGYLVLRVQDTPTATARVGGVDSHMDVMILPGSLRIENTAASTVGYEVVVPARLRTLRVRIGDAPEMVFRPADLGHGWSTVVGLTYGKIDRVDTEL
jgi:anti-sigma factor RsiW